MSPTFDLSCVGGLSNQLDGDPDRLDHMVGVFRKNAGVMLDSASNLERLRAGTGEMRADGFTAAAKKAFEVESGIRAAAWYYQQVADAVAGFSPVLREAQRKAPASLDQLHQAEARKAVAQSDYERARHYARNVDPSTQQQGVSLANDANRRFASADASLTDARNALRAAASEVGQANDAAAAKVKTATDNAGLKDSLWDKLAKLGEMIGKALVAIGTFIWENLDTIVLVLTVVSFFIPGGAPVMAVINGALRILNVLSTVKSLVGYAQDGWEVVQAVQDGDWEKAGRKVLAVGAAFALRKVTSKVARVAGRASGKEMFSLDKSGKMSTTATGRAIDRVITKLGPVIKNADGSEPTAFMSRHIDRSTQVITNVTEWTYKQGLKMVTKPLVNAIEGPSSDSPKADVTDRHAGGGGGGSGGGGW